MEGSKVLIVEDDLTLLSVLKYNLVKEGYLVVTAADGVESLEVARREKPELIVLDVMLPKLDGFEVCRILRREMIVPILMVTARSEEIDKVVGLELGADDYMTKPFGMREFLSRVRAMLRRTEMMKPEATPVKEKLPPTIKAGELEVDLARHQVSMGGGPLDLGPKEFNLLVFLMRNQGQVFSRDHLLEKVWGYEYVGGTRTVDVHIRWLRQKIESDPSHPRFLLTVRGAGYKFKE
ncbi:MAG: response regulator transcription factor [Dehalococcoidia bacterium]|nr:response regulator transcription factor [Dehalococcoidia bacterium]